MLAMVKVNLLRRWGRTTPDFGVCRAGLADLTASSLPDSIVPRIEAMPGAAAASPVPTRRSRASTAREHRRALTCRTIVL